MITKDEYLKIREKLVGRVNELVELINDLLSNIDKPYFSQEEKIFLHQKAKNLKTKLKEYEIKQNGRSRLINGYAAAVAEASGHLMFKTNSDPNRSNWGSSLYDARIDLKYFLQYAEKQETLEYDLRIQ